MADPRLQDGIIVTTDATCRLGQHAWPGVPTLVWPEGIDEEASDWFRDIVVNQGSDASTAHEYANILRPFLRFCRQRNRDWRTVDDAFLVLHREHQRRAEGVGARRVNTVLKTVFAFYLWAERTGRLRYHVGIYAPGDLPAAMADTQLPITAVQAFRKGSHGRVHGSWTTPLTVGGAGRSSPMRHTPTEDEIRNLHGVLVEAEHGERNSLICSWMEEAGPRRAEVGRLCVSHMPTTDDLADVIERDEPWLISVRRKGGAVKPIEGPPDLLVRTLDYIGFERREVVRRCQREIVGYVEPDEIFLSSRTGMPLHPDSITAMGRGAFRRAGIRNASPHRLRARFAVRVIEELVQAIFGDDVAVGAESSWVETILVKASERMGHASPQSLRPYLTYVLNRRIQTADATKAGRQAAKARQVEQSVDAWVRRLDQAKGLHDIGALIQKGQGTKAAEALRRMADELT